MTLRLLAGALALPGIVAIAGCVSAPTRPEATLTSENRQIEIKSQQPLFGAADCAVPR